MKHWSDDFVDKALEELRKEKDAEIERLETVINSQSYHDGVSAQAEIARLKALLTRAADALEDTEPEVYAPLSRAQWWDQVEPLIAELRKAAG